MKKKVWSLQSDKKKGQEPENDIIVRIKPAFHAYVLLKLRMLLFICIYISSREQLWKGWRSDWHTDWVGEYRISFRLYSSVVVCSRQTGISPTAVAGTSGPVQCHCHTYRVTRTFLVYKKWDSFHIIYMYLGF